MNLLNILKDFEINGSEVEGTDKNTKHSYLEVYENLLDDYKDKEIQILEIGTQFGASGLLWQKYLSKSNVISVDIENQITNKIKSNLEMDRFSFLMMDAYKIENMSLYGGKKFDIIIDDGPHTIESQKFLIENYLGSLSDEGVMIIEDIQEINYIEELKKITPDDFYLFCYDLRNLKNRYDDIIVVIKKKKLADKNISLCYPVYNNQKAFDEIKDRLSVLPCQKIIVDDGSNPPLRIPDNEKFKLIRIETDRSWNQAQANNVSIRNSTSKVVLRLDIDHYIEPDDYQKFLELSMNMENKTIYQFERIRTDTNQHLQKGCNIMMIKKEDFDKIGEYDEKFCGNYGYEDVEFQLRAKKMEYVFKVSQLKVFVDARNKTIGLSRDTKINKELLEKIKSQYGNENNRL